MHLETASVCFHRIPVCAVYSRRPDPRSPPTPEDSPSSTRRLHYFAVLTEATSLVDTARIGPRRSIHACGDQLQTLLLHICHARFDGPHAVAGKLIGVLAAHSEHGPRKIRCREFHIGQVSDTSPFCSHAILSLARCPRYCHIIQSISQFIRELGKTSIPFLLGCCMKFRSSDMIWKTLIQWS